MVRTRGRLHAGRTRSHSAAASAKRSGSAAAVRRRAGRRAEVRRSFLISLAIDASTYVGTVAVIHDERVVARGEATMRGREAEALMPAVADTLRRAGVSAHDLSRLVCGSGPGSFTSLRIAASIAKGIAVGTGCPLFAASSLALLAVGGAQPEAGNYLAVLDALRGEAYVGGYRIGDDGAVTMTVAEQLVRHENVAATAAAIGAVTVGAGQSIE